MGKWGTLLLRDVTGYRMTLWWRGTGNNGYWHDITNLPNEVPKNFKAVHEIQILKLCERILMYKDPRMSGLSVKRGALINVTGISWW